MAAKFKRNARIVTIILTVVVVLGVTGRLLLWGVAMPVRDLPPPTGPYAIATLSYDLTDPTRREVYAPDAPEATDAREGPARPGTAEGPGAPDGPRTFRIQLWYPTESTSDTRVPWLPEGRRHIRAIVATHGFPRFIWDHTVRMQSNSVAGGATAPVVGDIGQLPVVLISHGWEGYRALHTDVAEELASHGALVVAADHSYGAAATALNDGRILQSHDGVLPERGTSDRFAELAWQLVTTFSADNRAILDHLERVAAGTATQGPPEALAVLYGRVTVEGVGVVGHSTGGGAMVHLTQHDPRVGAVVGLDAWVEPLATGNPAPGNALMARPLAVPARFLRSHQWEGGINDTYLLPYVAASKGASGAADLYHIPGTTHQQFSTLYMYAPAVQWLGLLGEIEPMGFAELQRDLVRDFLLAVRAGAPPPPVRDDRVWRVIPDRAAESSTAP